MRIFSYRRLRQLFSFASMGIARSGGRGIRRRNAFKQRRDAFSSWRVGNEQLEPRKMLAAATVSSTNWVGGGPLGPGDNVEVQIQFDQPVTGTGIVSLEVGGNTAPANLISGSGSQNLLFRYVVQNGDNDTDGVSAVGLFGSFTNEELWDHDNDAETPDQTRTVTSNTSMPSLSGGPEINTDTPSISISSDKSRLGGNTGLLVETAGITFTLSEDSTDFDVTDVTVTNGQLSSFNGTGAAYTATFTPDEDFTGTATINVAGNTFTNTAGNDNTAAAQQSIAVNTVRPTVTIAALPTEIGGSDDSAITFTLSADSDNFVSGGVNVTNGFLTAFAGSGSTFTAIFTPDNSGLVGTISVAEGQFTDADGNENLGGASASVVVDNTPPTATISSTTASLISGETAQINITLSEDSADFAASDVVVTNGSLSAFTGTGTTYSATFTPRTGFEGKATIDIPVGVFSDSLGNSNAVAPTTVEIDIDTEVPTVVITSDESNLGGNTGLLVDTANITFTLSENSSDFTITDVTVTNGQLSNFAGSNDSYTATFTPDEDFAGTATLDIAGGAFTDAPGNDNTPAAQQSIAVNTVRPTVAITANQTSIGGSDVAEITFTLSAPSNDFTFSTITPIPAAIGTLSPLSGTGDTYTAIFTPTAAGTAGSTGIDPALIAVAAGGFEDADGNTNAGLSTLLITIDTLAPTPAVAVNPDPIGGGETTTVTINLGEDSTDFTIDDIVATGGTLSNFQSASAQIYTVDFTPSADSTGGTINISATVYTDAAGNSNNALAAPATIEIIAPPTITLDPVTAGGATEAEATGAGATDLLTVTGEPGNTVSVVFTNGATPVTVDVAITGATPVPVNLTLVDLATLGDGTINVSATQQNPAGNISLAETDSFLLDTAEPTITGITTNAGVLGGGDALTFTVTLSETVDVTGTPTLDFEIDGAARSATLTGGNGTNTLTFSYTVNGTLGAAGDQNDTDGLTLTALTLNGGSISDEAGNDADLALPTTLVGAGTTFLMPQPVTLTISTQANSVDASNPGGPFIESPRATPVSYIVLQFDDVVPFVSPGTNSANGFLDLSDFELTQDGALIAWPAQAEIEQDISDPTRYLITNLSAITETPGTYILTFSDVAISDEQEITWIKTVVTPGQLTANISIAPNDTNTPRRTAVDSATVTFSESVVGVDLDDFELEVTTTTGTTTFGAAGTLWSTTNASIAADTTGIEYTITGLDTLTAEDASYELRIIQDPAITEIQTLASGNLITAISAEWDLDRSATIVGITPGTPPDDGGAPPKTLPYKSGATITFDVQFNEIVEVAGGTPTLPLIIGQANESASYVSGTGTDTLRFAYNVDDGDEDTNGLQLNGNTLSLNGATINDVAGIPATLTFPLPDLTNQKVDAVVPTLTVTGPNPGEYNFVALPAPSDVLDFNVTFDELVTITYTTVPTLSVELGGVTVQAQLDITAVSSGDTVTSLPFTYTVTQNDRTVNGLTIKSLVVDSTVTIEDSAGNIASSIIPETIVAGVVVNQVAITSLTPAAFDSLNSPKTAPTSLEEGDELTLTATFADTVFVTGIPQIGVRLGNTIVNANYVGGDGTTDIIFSYVIANGDEDLNGLQLPSSTIALNGGAIVDGSGDAVSLEFPVPTTPDIGNYTVDWQPNPIIQSIAPATNTPDGFYDINDTIFIEITTSQPVRVSGGQPTLALDSGITAVATYIGDSTSFSTTLLFKYEVTNGDDSTDLDYDDANSLVLPVGTTIQNENGKDLVSTLDAPGTAKSISFANDIVVNTAVPVVTAIDSNATDGAYGIGKQIRIFATLSEVVTASQTLDLILDSGIGRTVTLTTDGTNIATGDYDIQEGDDSADLSVLAFGSTNIVDNSGNPLGNAPVPPGSNLQDLRDLVIDTERPTIKSFTSTSPDGVYKSGGTIDLVATASETVTAGSQIVVTLNNSGTALLRAPSDGTTLTGTYTVDAADSSVSILSVDSFTPVIVLDIASNALQDTAVPGFPNNLSDSSTLEIDTAPPSIASISAPDGLYGLAGTINITVQLTEVLAAGQTIELTFDTGAKLPLSTNDTDTLIGIYTVGTGEDSADLTVTKAEAVGTVVDAAGNPFFGLLPTGTNLGDTSDVVVDTAAPTVVSITPDVTTLNSASAPAVLTIVLGEDSTDFEATDLTDSSGGTFANITGAGSNYTVEFTPGINFEGTTTITVSNGAFTDLAGNAYATDGTSASIDVDTLAPTITGIASPVSLAKSGTATVTFTVSESTANFDDLDLVTTGGTLTALAGAVPGTTYTATFTPTDDVNSGTGLISIAGGVLTDSAGNPNLASSVTILYDTQAPTVTITSDKASVGGNDGVTVETATLTFTLSEPSTDFIASDVVVVNGSIGTLTANGTNDVYTATFTPNSDFNGTATVDINAGAFTDPATNVNTAATQETIAVNTVRPTISISSAPTTPIGGPNTATVTFTLSAASADFTISDVVVSDGTLTGFSGSGASYTALFTPPANSTTTETISVTENVFTDGDGNGNTAATPASILVDTVAPSAPGISLSSSATGPIINFAEATSPLGLIDVTGDAGATINVVFTGVNGSVPVSVSGPSGVAILTAGNLTTLGDGPIAVTATQTDAAGNESLASASIDLELDATPPAVIGFASDKPAGHYKSGETFNLTASLSEQVSAGQIFSVTLNTGAAVLFTAPADGLFLEGTYVVIGNHNANPLEVTSILSAGTTEDDAGNALSTQLPAQSTFAGIVIDTVAPDQAVLSLLATDPVSANEAMAGFATVRGEAGATIVVTIANTTGQQVQRTLLGDGTDQLISLTLAELPILGEGLMTISASQTDEAGNAQTAPAASIPFTLDTTPPSTLALTAGAGVADGVTEAEATQVTGVARLTGEAGASVTITITDAMGNEVVLSPIIATGAEQAVRKTLTDLSQLVDGVIIASAVQTDAAGNTNAIPLELTFTLDRVAPSAPLVSLVSGITTPLTYAEATNTNGVVNVQGESGSEILVVFQGQNGTLSRNLTGTGSNEAIVLSDNDVTTILGEGAVTVSATQTDQAGNTSSIGTLSLEIDQTNPEVNSLDLIGSGPYGPLSEIPVEGTLSEPAEAGQILNVILNVLDGDNGTPVVVPVTVQAGGTVITGTYIVQVGHNTDDLTIDGHTNDHPSNPVTDLAGNLLLDSSSSGGNLKTLGGGSAGTLSTGIIIDTTPPEITEWLTTAGTYYDGDSVPIQLRINEPAMAGGTISVRPNTLGASRSAIVLELDPNDNTLLVGTYEVELGESTNDTDLVVAIESSTLTDLAGNALASTDSAPQSGVIVDGSITLKENGMRWGPDTGTGYSSVLIDLSTGVTGITIDAFTLTHNGRTVSLRDATVSPTSGSNYILLLPGRIANMGGGFTISIWSSDIQSIIGNVSLDDPIIGELPDPGMSNDGQSLSR